MVWFNVVCLAIKFTRNRLVIFLFGFVLFMHHLSGFKLSKQIGEAHL